MLALLALHFLALFPCFGEARPVTYSFKYEQGYKPDLVSGLFHVFASLFQVVHKMFTGERQDFLEKVEAASAVSVIVFALLLKGFQALHARVEKKKLNRLWLLLAGFGVFLYCLYMKNLLLHPFHVNEIRLIYSDMMFGIFSR
jgi:hypothetical protein